MRCHYLHLRSRFTCSDLYKMQNYVPHSTPSLFTIKLIIAPEQFRRNTRQIAPPHVSVDKSRFYLKYYKNRPIYTKYYIFPSIISYISSNKKKKEEQTASSKEQFVIQIITSIYSTVSLIISLYIPIVTSHAA